LRATPRAIVKSSHPALRALVAVLKVRVHLKRQEVGTLPAPKAKMGAPRALVRRRANRRYENPCSQQLAEPKTGYMRPRLQGRHGNLYVRIGGSDARWEPSTSRYGDYREYGQGAGWKVWIGLAGNPQLRQAPLKPALPAEPSAGVHR